MLPREKVQKNSKGRTDFRVKNMKIAPYGRKEIEMAEQGKLTYALSGMCLLYMHKCAYSQI